MGPDSITNLAARLAGTDTGTGLDGGIRDAFAAFGIPYENDDPAPVKPVHTQTRSKVRSKTSKAELKKRAKQSRRDRRR
jgi:hypothetical protein